MCKQVKFEIVNGDVGEVGEVLGGIAVYDDDVLINVICGCCGSVFEPEDVEILEKYDWWIDLVDTIICT